MAPLLLYIPPFFGLAPLTMQSVAGLIIVQGMVGCLAGSWIHKKLHFVSKEDWLAVESQYFTSGVYWQYL